MTAALTWAVRRRWLAERVYTKSRILELCARLESKNRASHKFYARAFKKLGFNGKRLTVQQNASVQYLQDCIENTFHFTLIKLRVTSVLGIGGEGVVFGGVWRDVPVAIKISRFESERDACLWQRQVDSQVAVNRQPGFRAPNILKHGVQEYCGKRFGIVVMEKIDITMDRVIRYLYEDPVVMRTVTRMLLNLLDMMRRNNFVHGDLHVSNVGYIRHDASLSLVLIDLERSVWLPCHEDNDYLRDADTYFLWRSSLFPGRAWIQFNYMLQQLGLPLTHGLTCEAVDHVAIYHASGDLRSYEDALFKLLELYDDTISTPILDAITERQCKRYNLVANP